MLVRPRKFSVIQTLQLKSSASRENELHGDPRCEGGHRWATHLLPKVVEPKSTWSIIKLQIFFSRGGQASEGPRVQEEVRQRVDDHPKLPAGHRRRRPLSHVVAERIRSDHRLAGRVLQSEG